MTGRRGTTSDLSFQVLNGDYTPTQCPTASRPSTTGTSRSPPDGSYRSVRAGQGVRAQLSPSARVRRCCWSGRCSATGRPSGRERSASTGPTLSGPLPATVTDRAGWPSRYGVARRMLLSRIRTFLAFPEWHYLQLPVNTMTEPRLTPGGLATQYLLGRPLRPRRRPGHGDHRAGRGQGRRPYQGFQLGSLWYVSLDYINHQTSLTADQARVDPDGRSGTSSASATRAWPTGSSAPGTAGASRRSAGSGSPANSRPTTVPRSR